MTRRRIAILGGGMAGLATAVSLTATPELREQHEVTIYQLGWRLGGKCATGRNRSRGNRIQEHGLHLWYGGYDNAFRILGSCYEELDRPVGQPFRNIEEAFVPMSFGILYDQHNAQWSHVINALPKNLDRPGRAKSDPIIFDLIEGALDFVILELRALLGDPIPRDPTTPPGPSPFPSWALDAVSIVKRPLWFFGEAVESAMLDLARAFIARARQQGAISTEQHSVVAQLIGHFRDWLYSSLVADRLSDDNIRHRFTRFDAIATTIIGILEDRIIQLGVDVANDREFSAWLGDHGAKDVTLRGGLVRSLYSAVFATNLGPSVADTDAGASWNSADHAGELAAGTSAIIMLGSNFVYRGAALWKPLAGFADVVVTPMYETLLARGVRFEFFSRVDSLGLSTGDSKFVEKIVVTRQAAVKRHKTYVATFDVNGVECWPSEPDWDQLTNGAKLRGRCVDFEAGELDEQQTLTRTLNLGEDFDDVVLAIHVAALPSICRELMADESNARFAAMIEGTRTVMTQGVQLWSTKTASELGWPYGGAVASSFIEPLDTYCDMSVQLPAESWEPDEHVRSVAYYCGILEEQPGDDPTSLTARVRDGVVAYMNTGALVQWPNASSDGGGFEWSVLHDPEERVGSSRLDAQFLRANVTATERYVQTPPGFHRTRLRANESGYPNLFLAGDWVRNGIDVGAVEGAVTAGLWASQAICGSPETIGWEEFLL